MADGGDGEPELIFDDEPGGDGSAADSVETTLAFDDEEEQSSNLQFDNEQSLGPPTASPLEAGNPDPQLGAFTAGAVSESEREDSSIGRAENAFNQFIGSAGEFFTQLPKAASFLASSTALGGPPVPPTEEELQDQEFGLKEFLFGKDAEAIAEDAQSRSAFQFGQEAGKAIRETFPTNPEFRDEFLSNILPAGAGDLAAFAGTTALSGGSNLAVGAALGASTQAPRAFEEAKADGASDDAAMNNFLANLGVGGLEAIPVARAFRRMDNATGGAVKKSLAKSVSSTARATVAGAGEEAIQEAVSTTLSNASAKTFFDESRGIFDNVPESAAAGFILGGALNGVGAAVSSKRGEVTTKQEEAELRLTGRKLNDQIDEAVNQGVISQERADNLKNLPTFTSPNDVKNRLKGRIDKAEEEGNIEPETAERLRKETDLSKFREEPDDQLDTQEPEDVEPEQTALATALEENERTFTDKAKKWILERGESPQTAARLEQKFDGKIDKEFAQAKRNIAEVERALASEFADIEDTSENFFGSSDEGTVPRSIYEDIRSVLTGDKNKEVLPQQVRGPVNKMRNHIDRLSTKLINSGAAEGDITATIERNLGTYLHTTNRRDAPNIDWRLETMPEEVKTNAAAHIKKQWKRNHGEDPSEAQVFEVMEEVMNARDRDETFQQAVGTTRLDYGPLKEKGDYPQAIRALWGDFTDGTIAYAKTVEKVANLAHGYEYFDKLATVGVREGWLVDKNNSTAEDRVGKKKVAPDDSEVMKPLAGMLAEPKVADAINEAKDTGFDSKMMEYIVRANGGMKFMATVGNQITHVRNFAGGKLMQANQGINPFNPRREAEAYRLVKADLGIRGPLETVRGEEFSINEETEARIDRLRELGLMDQSVRAGDLMGVLTDATSGSKDRTFADRLMYHKNQRKGLRNNAKSLAQQTGATLAQVYQAEDNMNRIIHFMAEAERYSKALTGKEFQNLEGTERRRIEEIAGNLTKRNFQDYSQVPRAVRKLRQQPWFGTFVSFPYEVARITVNTTRTAFREINHSNPDVRSIGRKRLVSQLSVTSGLAATASAAGMTAMAGIGMTDQEEEDLREFVAPWDENGALGMVGKEGGTYEFMNLSYQDPFQMIGTPVRTLATSEDPFSQESIEEFGKSMLKQLAPFYESDLITQKIRELLTNEDSFGGKIYNENESLGRFAGDVTAHFLDGFVPQIAKSGEELLAAYDMSPLGGDNEEVDTGNAWMSAAGLRVSKVDTKKSFEIQASKFADDLRGIRSIMNEKKFDDQATFSERVNALDRTNQRFRERAKQFVNKADAIFRLGMGFEETRETMIDAGVPKDEAGQIMRGVPTRMVDQEDLERDN